MTSPDPFIYRPANLWRRFGAFVHELFFLLAYLFIVALIFASFSGEKMSVGTPQILTGPLAVFQKLYFFAAIGLYFIYFWINGRRSLAFKTWQLQLTDEHGGVVHIKQGVMRYLACWIGPAAALIFYVLFGGKPGLSWLWIVALFFNFCWALIDRDKQFLHDRIAKTRVMLAPKND